MTISINGIGGVQASQNIDASKAKLQAVLAALASGKRINQASDDVAALATATELQSNTSALRTASVNLAQGASLAQVAGGGADQIQKALGQLQAIASQASSGALNADNRQQLNQQFQQLLSTIDQLANGTSFNGQKLLDGSLSGGNALSLDSLLSGESSGGDSLAISSLTTGGLFGSQSLDVLTSGNAQNALAAISSAISQVTSAQAGIGAFQQTVNFAAANVDSAIINQEAAQSSLTDTDIAAASTQSSLANIQQNAAIALAAQGNRLSPALLQLIG